MELYLKEKSRLIQEELEKLLPERNTPYNTLSQAARYSLMGNGKRIRPILALATVESLGGHEKTALPAVCALELVHTYSLIHDDLPCMDNDDFRRGKPTLHKIYPEGHAVLAGDFLLTFAFEILANTSHLSPTQKVELIKILAQNSGGDGMIAGQIMDIEAEGKQINLEMLKTIHQYKTGKMITASILFGGILANADASNLELLKQFGDDIGLSFQIVDDILDVTASEQKHGKSIASDQVNHKATYVSLLGLEKAKEEANKLLHSALEKLHKLPCETVHLKQLAEFIVNRNH
jgi:geranylgeranyl diphosphate synthase, type II